MHSNILPLEIKGAIDNIQTLNKMRQSISPLPLQSCYNTFIQVYLPPQVVASLL